MKAHVPRMATACRHSVHGQRGHALARRAPPAITAMLHTSSVEARSTGTAPGPGSAIVPNGILRLSQRTKSANAARAAPAS